MNSGRRSCQRIVLARATSARSRPTIAKVRRRSRPSASNRSAPSGCRRWRHGRTLPRTRSASAPIVRQPCRIQSPYAIVPRPSLCRAKVPRIPNGAHAMSQSGTVAATGKTPETSAPMSTAVVITDCAPLANGLRIASCATRDREREPTRPQRTVDRADDLELLDRSLPMLGEVLTQRVGGVAGRREASGSKTDVQSARWSRDAARCTAAESPTSSPPTVFKAMTRTIDPLPSQDARPRRLIAGPTTLRSNASSSRP